MRRVPGFITALLSFSIILLAQAGKQPTTTSRSPQSAKPATSAPAPAAKPGTVQNPAAAPKDVASKDATSKDPNIEAAREALRAMQTAQQKRKEAEALVHEWFLRWSTLDGKEESLKRLLELYHPDAIHETGPNDRQLGGAVLYQGHRLIRKMAEDFSKTWTAVAYRIAMRTVKEKTAELIQTSEAPWGATQVAVEFTGGQANPKTKKRFMLRGAAFFEIENGKFTKVRTYVPRDEMLVITGPLSVTM